MALKQNTFEGGTSGTTISTGNSGGASGNAFDAITVTDTLTYTSAQKMHGTLAALITGTTGADHMDFTGYAATQMAARLYVRFSALPAASVRLLDIRTNTVSVGRVSVDSSNRFVFQTNNGTTTLFTSTAISANTWYRVEAVATNGTSGSTLKFDYYAGDSGTPVETGFTTAAGNAGTTANITQVQVGYTAVTTYSGTTYIDDVAVQDGRLTYLGAASNPPTAAFTYFRTGLQVTTDGVTSTPGGASITNYAFDFGDGGTTSGAGTTATHTYATAGTYTIILTVTDSNGLTGVTTQSVTVSAPGGTVTAESVNVSTGWIASTGTVLACITDGDNTTFATSTAAPSAQEFDFTFKALTPPATGQPLKVFLTADAPLATSATLDAQLFEGSTQRSSLTGVTIPSGSGSTVNGLVTLTFPWSDVSAVTTAGWNAMKVKLQVTAA